MRRILASRNLARLAEFASSNVLIAFDYDGTLAPIAGDPARVGMRARTRRLLAAVALRYPCVVVSGRSRDDVSDHIAGIPIWHVAGNHGIEPWAARKAAYVKPVARWAAELNRQLAAFDGVAIENKTYSLTVHYRRARTKRRAIAAVLAAVQSLPGARAIPGIESVSVVPRRAPNKATAIERVRRLLSCDTAIYVGDDGTDEDVFRGGRSKRLLGIRVGVTTATAAEYGLRSQREVDALLRALVRLRSVESPAPRRRMTRAFFP